MVLVETEIHWKNLHCVGDKFKTLECIAIEGFQSAHSELNT